MLLQAGRIALNRALAQRRQFGVFPDYPLDQFTQREQNAIPVVIVGLEAVTVREKIKTSIEVGGDYRQYLFSLIGLPQAYRIAMLFDFKLFQREFISSSRLCNMTASSCEVSEPSNLRPVPSRRS